MSQGGDTRELQSRMVPPQKTGSSHLKKINTSKLSRYSLFYMEMQTLNLINILTSYDILTIYASRIYRIPEKQFRKSNGFMNCARSCFYQYANHLPNHLLSIELKYPDFFTTFRFASFHFILFCASWVLSCEFTLSKGKNFEETLCLQPRHFVSISLHLRVYANYCSSAAFRFPRDSVMAGFVNLAEQTVVEDFIVSQAPQTSSEEGE